MTKRNRWYVLFHWWNLVVAMLMWTLVIPTHAQQEQPAAAVETPAIAVPQGQQEIKGEVQLRGALLRSNDTLLAKDEEIARLNYLLAKLQRLVNDADRKRLEPELLKSFGAPPGSLFDWGTFKPVPPPQRAAQPATAPAPVTGVKIVPPDKGKS